MDDRYAAFCRGAFWVQVRLIARFANKTGHAIDQRVDKSSGTFCCLAWIGEEDATGKHTRILDRLAGRTNDREVGSSGRKVSATFKPLM